MDIRHLACFVSAVDCGSMSRGALAQNLSQPTFSTRIQQLEASVGVRLLHRNGRGVVATAAGTLFYERVKPLLKELDAARIEAAAADGKDHGEVVVGIVPTAAGRLSPALAEESRAAPVVPLRVVESFSGHLQTWLQQGDIDIVVGTAMPASRRIRQIPLASEPLQLVGRRNAASLSPTVALKALAGVPLVLGSQQHSIRRIIERVARRHQLALNVAYEVDGLDVQLRFVQQGLGYAILPAGTVPYTAYASSLQTWTLVDPAVTRPLVIAYLPKVAQAKPRIADVVERIILKMRRR